MYVGVQQDLKNPPFQVTGYKIEPVPVDWFWKIYGLRCRTTDGISSVNVNFHNCHLLICSSGFSKRFVQPLESCSKQAMLYSG
jgi:hypothetical protein